MRYLSVDFLNLLPIDSAKAREDPLIYAPFFTKVKAKLMESNLLPGLDRYRSPKESAISRSEDLRKILSEKQLGKLKPNLKNINWLNTSITEDNYPVLRDYLSKELNVLIIDPITFSEMVNAEFFLSQTDDWMISFYSFLNNQRSLWDSSSRNPILRKKPIIRLYDNSQIEPFDADGKPKANLPTDKLTPEFNHRFNTVNENLLKEKTAKQFLTDLGLREIGKDTVILEYVLPKYTSELNDLNEESNLRDLEWIAKTLRADLPGVNTSLINEIKKHQILLSINARTKEREFKRPSEVFLPCSYSESSELDSFYEDNDKIWFLDERYREIPSLDICILSALGCKTEIEIKHRNPDRNGYVNLENSWGNHKRGVDSFDPEATILELKSALAEPNIKKAKIIWSLLSRNYKLIGGTTETSTRESFIDKESETSLSTLGELLIEHKWIPTKDKSFKKPGEIKIEDIDEVILTGIQESSLIAEKLGIKDDFESRVLEKYPLLKQLQNLPTISRKEAESAICKILRGFQNSESSDPVKENMGDIFKKHHSSQLPQNVQSSEDSIWKSIQTSEEEAIRNNYANNTKEKMNNSNFSTKHSISKEYKSEYYDPKTFLMKEYDGHCQACNTLLDLGDGREPYFETYRIIKESEMQRLSEGEFNVICLCPNCHALAQHGGLELSDIYNSVTEIINGNKISEAVPERNGDFYIFKVLLATQPVELFYTQRHINQVVSILSHAEDSS